VRSFYVVKLLKGASMADNLLDDIEEFEGLDASLDSDNNFNDAELQDIMAEIEDLEKDFVGEDSAVVTPKSLQEKIDEELEEIGKIQVSAVEINEEIAEEITEEIPHMEVNNTVLAFEKKSEPNKSEVSFAAQGQMALKLDFLVGSEAAQLSIDPIKGLTVILSGVELCINEVSGCTVSMENGMKFTIPLSSQANSLKKKIA
jgi:hypothetical protein